MRFILPLIKRYQNLILYGIIGSLSASIDFAIYVLLEKVGMYYLVANIVSVSVGIVVSFILNRHFNFKVKDRVIVRFMSFLTIGIIGMLTSSALLYLFIDIVGIGNLMSKLTSIAFVVIAQFIANKYITFKPHQ